MVRWANLVLKNLNYKMVVFAKKMPNCIYNNKVYRVYKI